MYLPYIYEVLWSSTHKDAQRVGKIKSTQQKAQTAEKQYRKHDKYGNTAFSLTVY